ncbi:MAG: carotenoid 1,2-hydratase, partial [Variovorax sp.]|nr:carotenoid 1,2-hydratase [Variovorax sp.]
MQRRAVLLHAAWAAAAFLPPGRGAAAVLAPRPLEFPRDFGSHPDLRTEWWYVTGSARSGAREFGFQVTFFRSRIDGTQALRSAFAARQLIFAHAAVTDLQGRKLWHDQRIARAGMGVASAGETDTALHLRDWSLVRGADGYRASVATGEFTLDLHCAPTQPVLAQGDAGLSRKGPAPDQASYYYSEPQLATRGRLQLQGQAFEVTGTSWLDHEWSDVLMHPDAVGWDWIGMNLADGGALTAFRLRDRAGAALWSGGSFRRGRGSNGSLGAGAAGTARGAVGTEGGGLRVFSPGELAFEPLRRWKSPASGATYPVDWAVRTPAGRFTVKALLDDQELDSRGSTGSIYWEGLSELRDERGAPVG